MGVIDHPVTNERQVAAIDAIIAGEADLGAWPQRIREQYERANVERMLREKALRLLDRHMAGLVLKEVGVAAGRLDIYRAANLALRQRADDAVLALRRAVDGGIGARHGNSWGELGVPAPLHQIVLLDSITDTAFDEILATREWQPAPLAYRS